MFKASSRAVLPLPVFSIATAVVALTSCGSSDSQGTWSTPEPRVATYSAGSWSVDARQEDMFSTSNSIFAAGLDGHPVALRDLGGELLFGTWDGANWTSESAGNLATVDDDDQLYSGTMVIDSNGYPHAMFVTLSWQLYYAGKTEAGWVITQLADRELSCYDIAIGPGNTPEILVADPELEKTFLSRIDSNGIEAETELPVDAALCGSVAVADDGTVGVALLQQNEDDYSSGTVKLLERTSDAEDWTSTDVATDAYYYCAYCFLPEIDYRGDGAPVMLYINKSVAVYLAERAEDNTFKRNSLTTAGQQFQLTRLKRASDGSLATAVIVNQANIYLATSSADGFALSPIGQGVSANTPRLAWTTSGAFVFFWDVDGVWSILPNGSGGYDAHRVDESANDGYYLGGFVSVGDDGIPQVFYNEWHQNE